jgi:hypothetical protein
MDNNLKTAQTDWRAYVDSIMKKNGGYWGDHPNYPSDEWQDEIANGDTRLGYWEWVAKQLDSEE